jgi:hypothetical protein
MVASIGKGFPYSPLPTKWAALAAATNDDNSWVE